MNLLKKKVWLFFFANHLDGFLRAFVGTNPATLAIGEVDLKFLVYCRIRAVGCTEAALVALLFVNNRPEDPPGPGLSGCTLNGPAHRETLAFWSCGHLAHLLVRCLSGFDIPLIREHLADCFLC